MCKLSEVPARFLDFAKASPVFACVLMSLTICGGACWYIGEVVSHHNDRLCDLMTMQTQAQVETAKAIQLLAVRIENIVSGYGSLHWPFSYTFLGADDNANCKVFLTSSL